MQKHFLGIRVGLSTLLAVFICGSLAAQPASSKSTNIPFAAKAKVLKVTAWGFGLADPNVKDEKVDVYSVTLKNTSKPSLVLEYANVTLTARSHGQPDVLETILQGSDGGFAGAKPVPSWTLPLKPGATKTVFFVTRSGSADQYCAGGSILKPQKCSRHG